MRTITKLINLCDPRSDSFRYWTFLRNLLLRLNTEGMSSDETVWDERQLKDVYRVKIVAWRRDISEYLNYIDMARDDPEIFTNRGSKPVERRVRGRQSGRPAKQALPRVFYTDDWFTAVEPDVQCGIFEISCDEFTWLELEDRNRR